MLDLHEEDSREAGGDPVLLGLPRKFLLDAVVAFELEALAVFRLEARVRRRFAKPVGRARKMTVSDHERIVRRGMGIVSPGQAHPRGEVHVAAPELREALAPD